MVQNSQWGPLVWKILHTVAEHLGVSTNPLVAADEARTWVQLLKSVEAMMPCPLCRNQYRTWRLHNPIEKIGFLRGGALRVGARDWMWRLHENVNRDRGVQGMTVEEAERVYAARTREELQKDVDTLLKLLTEATQIGQADPNAVRTWKASLSLMRRLVSF